MTSGRSALRKLHDTTYDRKRRIYDFLKGQHVGVLSTVTPDGNPHGSVVYYVLDNAFRVHILTKTGTRKYDNIVHNHHVLFTVFEPKTQTVVQIAGVAIERRGYNAINKVANDLFVAPAHDEGGSLPPIVKLQAGLFTTFRIEPIQMWMAIYARPDSGNYSELFDSIESFGVMEAG